MAALFLVGKDVMYTIKEVSEMMGISIFTLRYYDNEGLFPMLSRQNKRRFFSENDIQLLSILQCLREIGMSIAEMRHYASLVNGGDPTGELRLKIIEEQQVKAREELKRMKERIKTIDKKQKYYQAFVRGDDPRKHLPKMCTLVKDARILDLSKKASHERAKRVRHDLTGVKVS